MGNAVTPLSRSSQWRVHGSHTHEWLEFLTGGNTVEPVKHKGRLSREGAFELGFEG